MLMTDVLRLMLSWGRASPSPDPLPRALRAKQGYRVRMRFIFARSALGRGSGGGLALPQESINLKKSLSVSNALPSYDRACTVLLKRTSPTGKELFLHGAVYENLRNVNFELLLQFS